MLKINSLLQPSLEQQDVATSRAFGEALLKLGYRYKNVVVLDANYGRFLHVGPFAQAFPDRYFNFGNAEQNMLSAAAGFTVRGKVPLVCSFGLFGTGRGWEQIRNSICYPYLNVKIIGAHSGLLVGEDGASYQALEDMAIMRAIPNMKIVCPADSVETKLALETICTDYGPTYLRLGTKPVPAIYNAGYKFILGKGHVYKPGTDVCIFALGTALHLALAAAELLERDNLTTMVVNISTLEPIDRDLVVECAKQARNLVTVEDHQVVGGLGSAVSEVLTSYYPSKLLRLGMSSFGESGKVADLYKKYRLDAQGIFEDVRSVAEYASK